MTDVAVTTPTETERSEILSWLAEAEVANCIQVATMLSAPSLAAFPLLLVARHGSQIVGLANWGKPFNLVLAANTDLDAVEVIAETARSQEPGIPGVLATPKLAEAFATAWTARSGGSSTLHMGQRILAATEVMPPTGVPGSWRVATGDDVPMLTTWFQDFAAEADHATPAEAIEQGTGMAKAILDTWQGFIWLDERGEPVSIACAKAPTVHGIRIGPVYTPPAHRRRGYAAAVTAIATQHHLDAGRDFVCLYTDAANPTSNKVYESIGYRHVTDSVALEFAP